MSEVKKTDKKTKGPSPEDILNGFHQLRNEQKNLATKLSSFEFDVNEHSMVVETLKNVDPERRCHRLIGGVLVEDKVKNVLPAIVDKKKNIEELIENYKELLMKKGQELNEYKEKHSIRIRGQDDLKSDSVAEELADKKESRGNVLVS